MAHAPRLRCVYIFVPTFCMFEVVCIFVGQRFVGQSSLHYTVPRDQPPEFLSVCKLHKVLAC
jgi:hypothetical protein